MKTKAKLLLPLLALFTFTLSVKAQIISGGIVGGVSTSAVRIENVGNGFTDVIQGDNIHGFEAGIFARLKFGPFYVKPTALYNFSMGDMKSVNETNTAETNKFTIQRIEAPLLFGIKILGPVSIEGGPVYNYVLQSTGRFENNELNISQGTGIGYRIGLAAETLTGHPADSRDFKRGAS